MLLAHLLRREGIDAVVLEQRDRDYVEARVRAGVLEPITVRILDGLGLAGRLRGEGLVHAGINLLHDDQSLRVDMRALTGEVMTVYGQQELMRDLFEAAAERGLAVEFGAQEVGLHDLDTDAPFVTWRRDGLEQRVDCDFVAGCDGFHGVARSCVPQRLLRTFERQYPFGWLGILAEVPPAHHELIYCNHERGFALASMRSLTRSRYYIQCDMEARVDDWPDDRFWDELCLRLGPLAAAGVVRGSSFEKSITPLRSFVAEPMRYGRLLLAGDAAHVVPPTGAKGLNLAASDVLVLSQALAEYFLEHSTAGIDAYSARALARVWKAERFSWWFTGLTHRFPGDGVMERRFQAAEIDYIRASTAAQTVLAENYIGLPLQ
jgi:p-hydroxybenzoate 3-monooxygenase